MTHQSEMERVNTVRVSFVMLALFMPALFSSLLTFSPMGEGKSAQTASGDTTLSAVSFLISDLEQETTELSDEEADSDVLTRYLVSPTHYVASTTDRFGGTLQNALFNHNEIRGPPRLS